jgi:5-methylcytosine-specific restriction endonuclease McrA
MKQLIKHIRDRIVGKVPSGSKRSGHWPKIREDHLKANPKCAVCGGDKTLEVHHIRPFHLHPDLELDPTNLITLCETKKNGVNCHLLFGHLGSFKSFNVDVKKDSSSWIDKILKRPTSDS